MPTFSFSQPATKNTEVVGALPSVLKAWIDNPTQVGTEKEGALVLNAQGGNATLTIDLGLQKRIKAILEQYKVPQAGVVAIEPSTGRVLAFVNHGANKEQSYVPALDASAPAASVFKIITAAALLNKGVKTNKKLCFGGGHRRLKTRDLEDHPKRDAHCATFAEALGHSYNAVFAKLADRKLASKDIRRFASAFGFGQKIPFDVETQVSKFDIPEKRLEFARMSAGFWHSYLSPLHGALIAATVANKGKMMTPALVDYVSTSAGKTSYRHQPKRFRKVISASTAKYLKQMMEKTVTEGTSRRWFFDRKGRSFLPKIRAAGKTGTLSSHDPYQGYSWWVGFAPVEQPQVAIGILLVNEPKWRIKASYVAREAFRHVFQNKKPPTKTKKKKK